MQDDRWTCRRGAALLCAIAGLTVTAAPAVAQRGAARRPDTTRAAADTTPRKLQTITVVGTRARDVAPPVSTIDVPAEQLLRTPSTNAYDLVRRATGIEVHEQGQGPGFASDAVIRGFTSDHSSDVLLTIDGVPINLPLHGHVEGYADWSILSPASVSAMRVITGPASPVYGDFALGGVVEVTTAPDANGRAGAFGGSTYGDVTGWARAGRRATSGGGVLTLDGRREEGWRDNAGYRLGNAVARGWRRAGTGRVEGGVLLYGSSWDSPGFVSVDRYNLRDLDRANDPTDGGNAERLIVHGRYARPVSTGGTLDFTAWGQGVRSRVFLGVPDDGELAQTEERDRRLAAGAQAELRWDTGAGEFSAGVEGRADGIRYELYHTAARVRQDAEQDDDGRFLSGGAFARWRGLLGHRVAYDLGARADLLHYASLDRLTAGTDRVSATPLVFAPKLGLRFLTGGPVALLASVSRGFRGAVGVIHDPGRPPVVAWAKEVGALFDDGRLRAQLALFHTAVARERIQDPVTREISDEGKSVRRGASLDATYALTDGLRLTAEGTLNDARITEAGAGRAGSLAVPETSLFVNHDLRPSFHEEPLVPGARVPGVTRFFGRAGAELTLTPAAIARAMLRFTGPYTPIGEPSVRTRAYAVMDVGATIRLGAVSGALDLDLLNLLDARYPELRASGFVNPGSPRALRAVIRFGQAG